MGRSSRLYRLLVDTARCTAAGSSFGLTKDPYLFNFSATLQPNVSLEEVERTIFEEIERIQREGVRAEEVEKAVKQVRAQFVYASEGVTNQAYWLGDLEMVSHHTMLDDFVDRIAAVTPAEVQRVAKTYLAATNRTVGWFEPSAPEGATETPTVAPKAVRPWYYRDPDRQTAHDTETGGGSTLTIRRQKLPNGIVILGHERTVTPAVVVRANIQAGSMYDPPRKEGLATFAARMMHRGTSHHTFQQISELTDRVGASLSVDGGEHSIQVSGRSLRDDLDLIIGLMTEVIREPIFPPGEIDKLRGQVLTSLREQEDDTRSTVEKHFRELAYPADHPYHRWPFGDEASVTSFTRDDLTAFHRRYIQPTRMSIAYSGGIGFDEFVAKIAKAFSGWSATGPSAPFGIPDAPVPSGLIRRDYTLPGKIQSDIALGRPAVRRSNPDFYPLSMVDLILGGLGLAGRLGTSVRDELGLAYYVYSGIDASVGPSPWEIRAGVNPSNIDKAIDTIVKEVERIRTELVDEDEIADSKSYLTGILPLSVETNDGVARLLQRIEMFDLGLDYLDRYPGIINSLTREQLREAAQKYFSTDQLVVVTAGPG
jgi:zinc protease